MKSQLSLSKPVNLPEKWLPVILLLLAGLTIFLTERTDGGSIDGSISSGISAHGMTLSKNLMQSDHPLFMYSRRELHDGKISYDSYNRFPVFPFFVTGLLTQPFDSNLSLQIYIARQIMNVFFFLTIIMVYKLINMLTQNRYLALSTVLIIFSSYFLLSYNDLIFNDIPALLGFVVALYCVVKSQKQKLKISEILFYSMFPVSVGWQPFAVFTSWVFVDSFKLFTEKKLPVSARLSNFIKSPSVVILGTAIIWGIMILGFQLLNEWRIVGGAFFNIPSVNSGLWRTGLSSASGHTSLMWSFDWLTYLPGQFHSMVLMLIPFWPVFQAEPGYNIPIIIVAIFIIHILVKHFKYKDSDSGLFLIMTLSGLFWTIPMRHFVALHDFQSIFYVGFAISIFVLLYKKVNFRFGSLFTVIITSFFIVSVALTNHYKTPLSSKAVIQIQDISTRLPANSKVHFDGDINGRTRYVELLLSDCIFTNEKEADYIISQHNDSTGIKLTSNSNFNLFKVYPNGTPYSH